MTDREGLYKDFEKFIKRLRYAYQEHHLEYIAVAEPEESRWSMGVMLKSDKPELCIDSTELEKFGDREGLEQKSCTQTAFVTTCKTKNTSVSIQRVINLACIPSIFRLKTF